MKPTSLHFPGLALAALVAAGPATLAAQETANPEGRDRRVIEIRPTDQVPTVRAIAPIDSSNVLFLNHRGQLGMAKFSPGLSQIGWQLYSEVKLNALPALVLGPNYSALAASPAELTQAFDTDQNLELDFFQALVRDWPGREAGVVVTAGPVADAHGRVLFALSPHAAEEGAKPKARLVAWHPQLDAVAVVTESELPIESFAVSRSGLLAARLSLPDYTDGYFLSLTELPPPPPPGTPPAPEEKPVGTGEGTNSGASGGAPDGAPDASPAPEASAEEGTAAPDLPGETGSPSAPPPPSVPFTLPSLILPAELSKGEPPTSPVFFLEGGREKLLLACPDSRRLVEVVPDPGEGLWQGSVILRGLASKPPRALAAMASGAVLGGGDEGFFPVEDDPSVYRIVRLERVADGLVVALSRPVDRFEAVKPENYSLKAIALGGGETALAVDPFVDFDGRTIKLKSSPVGGAHVLRLACQNLPSESGEALLAPTAFYTIHAP